MREHFRGKIQKLIATLHDQWAVRGEFVEIDVVMVWMDILGYETIHYIPPMSLILYPSRIDSLNAEIQADMMRIMKEKGLLRRPFMIHLFSNSGYINWCYYQRHLQKHVPNTAFNIYYKIQGTIVDSAPCNLNPEVLARGFLGALIPKARIKLARSTLFFYG